MTDQPQIHIDPTEGSQLRLKQAASPADVGKLFISVTGDNGVVATTYIPPAELLAMIDTLDPDAMRAYLRERSDLMDSPHGPAAEHFDYLDTAPKADSPEDVDEQPEPDLAADDELMSTRSGRLLLVQRVAHNYPSASPAEHLVVADWILGPEAAHIEDLTLSGESLNR